MNKADLQPFKERVHGLMLAALAQAEAAAAAPAPASGVRPRRPAQESGPLTPGELARLASCPPRLLAAINRAFCRLPDAPPPGGATRVGLRLPPLPSRR